MALLQPMLEPYRPTAADPFDAVKAAHLLNRAGFGGTAEEIEKIRALGPAAAADYLLNFPDAAAETQNPHDVPSLKSIEGYPENFRELAKMMAVTTDAERKMIRRDFQEANHEALVATIAWWLDRMAHGPHPLQEKLALFWHGHFTTSAKDERQARLMWDQNELLRRNAAANFAKFVHAVAHDPAMLDYLNSQQNRKAHPNENFARELMELFTLGIGNYTEPDIKQAARAFTGWSHDGAAFVFHPFEHDEGVKTFFGFRGNFNGDDIIDIILQHPACPRYIAGCLFSYLAYEDADESILRNLGYELRDAGYELRPLLRRILTSRAFYSPLAVGSQVKSPVQLVIGAVRALGLEMPKAQRLGGTLNQMGQMPFYPPNVKGWPGGRAWINTSTLFVRYNSAVALANAHGPYAAEDGSASDIVDRWVARLIQRPIDPAQRGIFIDAISDKPNSPDSVRRLVQLIVSCPEYQLC